MKRRLPLLFIPLLVLSLASCGEKEPTPIASAKDQILTIENGKYILDFYAINDFHGAVVQDQENLEPGIESLGGFIRAKRNANLGGSFFISSGDMFQGSADSNITNGRMVMEMMNILDFEVNTVGNHEFDWGIDTLLQSMETVKAEFPLLACNIIDKEKTVANGSKTYVDWAEPYKLIERGVGADKVKVGIIGSIANQLEQAILTNRVRNFEFEEPLAQVKKYSEELRAAGADVIIYTTHGDANNAQGEASKGGSIHAEIPNYVDVIFTGHAHREVNSSMKNSAGKDIPMLQGKNNGEQMSYVSLSVDKTTREVKTEKAQVLKWDELTGSGNDASMKSIYNRYYKNEIKKIKEEKIGKTSGIIQESTLGQFTVDKILEFARATFPNDNVIAAFHNNSGGVRAKLPKGTITYGDVYKALPFDNSLYLVSVEGFRMPSSFRGGLFESFAINKSSIQPYEVYRICIVSYVAEHETMLLDGTKPSNLAPGTLDSVINYQAYPRDIVADAFRNAPGGNPLG